MLEKLFITVWNRIAAAPSSGDSPADQRLDLGCRIVDGELQSSRSYVPQSSRAEHIAILGKTGKGKSFCLRHLSSQDVEAGLGFAFFDLHGDTMPFLLRLIAAMEKRRGVDLSDRLVVIEPGDPEYSIGLNVLEADQGQQSYVQLAEFAKILKSRWHLDSLGARTEELLRNALWVLADNGLTLLELSPLLTRADFRAACVSRVQNTEVVTYFRTRFDTRSDASQGVYREAILNKISGFTADPRFRHILGQQRSTFSLLGAMDRAQWVILNLDKGRLGEQAATLGSLLLTKLKNALFSRRRRRLFTLYCDEIQNLVAYDAGLDTLLSEARKFGISVVSANQFLQQYPPQMRAAIMAVGTHIVFQLSSTDAEQMAGALDGGKRLAEVLKNLPKRHMVVKSGSRKPEQVLVPTVAQSDADFADLYSRCRRRWARRRTEVEAEIRARQQQTGRPTEEVLNDWNRRPPVVIQDRDRHLLSELSIMRVIDRETAKVVAGFHSTRRANARLLQLTRGGLLKRFFVGSVAHGRKAVYTLSAKGGEMVNAGLGGISRGSGRLVVSDAFTEHQTAINDMYVAFKYRPIPSPDVRLLRWHVFRKPISESVKLTPDGYLIPVSFKSSSKSLLKFWILAQSRLVVVGSDIKLVGGCQEMISLLDRPGQACFAFMIDLGRTIEQIKSDVDTLRAA